MLKFGGGGSAARRGRNRFSKGRDLEGEKMG